MARVDSGARRLPRLSASIRSFDMALIRLGARGSRERLGSTDSRKASTQRTAGEITPAWRKL